MSSRNDSNSDEIKETTVRTTWIERLDVDKLAYICSDQPGMRQYLSYNEDDPSWDPLCIPRKILAKSRNGKIEVEYTQSSKSEPNTGRYYARGSMGQQSMAREIRHTVAGEFYDDVDIVNAHPVILAWKCDEFKIPCPLLKEYNANRDDHITAIQKGSNCSRDDAKVVVLSLMNGGVSAYYKLKRRTDWLEAFKDEVNSIHDGLIGSHYAAYKKHKEIREASTDTNKHRNHEASFCNTLLCNTENDLLQTMIAHCIEDGTLSDECVWAFDGFQIPKNSRRDNNKLIETLERVLLTKHSITIKLKVKTMDDVIPLPANVPKYREPRFKYYSDYIHSIVGKEMHESDVKQWVDNSIIFVDKGGNSEFYTKDMTIDATTGEPLVEFERVSKQDLWNTLEVNTQIINPHYDKSVTEYIDDLSPGERRKVKSDKLEKYGKYNFTLLGRSGLSQRGYLDHCLKMRTLPTYTGIDFYPYLRRQHPHGYPLHGKFNMFDCFPLENIELNPSVDYKKVWLESKTYQHWKTDFFHGNEGELRHWNVYIADMIQAAATMRGITHVFQSGQGTGKSHMAFILARMVGDNHAITFGDMDTYFQRFNADQSNKLFKVFEEVNDKGSQLSNHNKLKYELDAKTKRIEFKNGSILHMRQSSRSIFNTNNRNSFYIEPDDRRYTLHSISMDHAQQWDYFAPMWKEANSTEFCRAMFEFYATFEYEPQEASRHYETRYKFEQKIRSLPNSLKFVVEFVENNFNGIFPADGKWFRKASVWVAFNSWCKDCNVKPTTQAVFDEHIRKVGVETGQKHEMSVGKRERAYMLDRSELQNGFRVLMKSEHFTFNIS